MTLETRQYSSNRLILVQYPLVLRTSPQPWGSLVSVVSLLPSLLASSPTEQASTYPVAIVILPLYIFGGLGVALSLSSVPFGFWQLCMFPSSLRCAIGCFYVLGVWFRLACCWVHPALDLGEKRLIGVDTSLASLLL